MAADRKVGPLEVACPTCGALTGLQCMAGGKVNPGVFHSARIKEASTRTPIGVGHREKAEKLLNELVDLRLLGPAGVSQQQVDDLVREYHEELFAAVWERDPGKIS